MRPPPFLPLLMLAASCGKPAPPAGAPADTTAPARHHCEQAGQVMGSDFRIEVFGSDAAACDRAVTAARAELDRIDAMMTDWKPESPLMDVNRAAGRHPVRVPPELFFLIRRSLQVSELSGGAFDITFGAVGRLWNWRLAEPEVPSLEAVRRALEDVGWRHVRLDEAAQTVFLDRPGVRIGLDAIAPGYAADLAIEKIRSTGIRDALIDLSGDIRVIGRQGDRPWRIGIRHPREAGKVIDTLTVSDAAVSTSGDYGRFFVKDGRRYSHILDPRTGYPADACQSVTVVAPFLALADALATAMCVMGPEAGMALAEKMEGVEALIVSQDGGVRVSAGLKR